MSNAILIIGESGSGKSTAIRTLDPATTFIINVLGKPLPFQKSSKMYQSFGKENPKGNHYVTDNYESIIKIINGVNAEMTNIKTIIIDDFQYVMANEFMRRAKEKGYEKFTEMGQHVWQIINALNSTRQDLIPYILCHNDTDQFGKSKIKTIGKMLDDKIAVEGMFTVVLHSIIANKEYKFLTNNDGMHIAKSPLGMFKDSYIDNDLLAINTRILEYYNEDVNF